MNHLNQPGPTRWTVTSRWGRSLLALLTFVATAASSSGGLILTVDLGIKETSWSGDTVAFIASGRTITWTNISGAPSGPSSQLAALSSPTPQGQNPIELGYSNGIHISNQNGRSSDKYIEFEPSISGPVSFAGTSVESYFNSLSLGDFTIAATGNGGGTAAGPITVSVVSSVPEPSALLLGGMPLLALQLRRRRRPGVRAQR